MSNDMTIAEGLQALAAKVETKDPLSGTENILFVEDDTLISMTSVDYLEDLGYQVRAALTAQEAIQIMVEGFQPQLMCCDIVMPGGMNGVELSRQVHDIMPDVRVLLMSGYGAQAMDGCANQDGFRMLSKPYLLEELGSRVRRMLDGYL